MNKPRNYPKSVIVTNKVTNEVKTFLTIAECARCYEKDPTTIRLHIKSGKPIIMSENNEVYLYDVKLVEE